MTDLIRDILTSDVGSFAFVFGIIVTGGWIIYYVTKYVTMIRSEHATLTSNVRKMDSNIDEIRKDIAFMKGSMDILKSQQDLLNSPSPISLTEKGIMVAAELKAEDIIARNWEHIFKKMESDIKDKNPYDIQQYCIEEISVEPRLFFAKEDLDLIKKFAFAHGQPLDLYTRLIGVMVRDEYFKRKNISIEEIDKHAPV